MCCVYLRIKTKSHRNNSNQKGEPLTSLVLLVQEELESNHPGEDCALSSGRHGQCVQVVTQHIISESHEPSKTLELGLIESRVPCINLNLVWLMKTLVW